MYAYKSHHCLDLFQLSFVSINFNVRLLSTEIVYVSCIFTYENDGSFRYLLQNDLIAQKKIVIRTFNS